MSICVNCGKKLNPFTEHEGLYGDARTCMNCYRLFSTCAYNKFETVEDLNAHRETLVSMGITESGFSHIFEYVEDTQKKLEEQQMLGEKSVSTSSHFFEELRTSEAAKAKARKESFRCTAPDESGLYYHIIGARGRILDVYFDKCVITTHATFGSFITNNATDGEKTIYYKDCVGIQFKPIGFTIGYLQLETAGGTMNNSGSNFFNENTFTFDNSFSSSDDEPSIVEKMEVVTDFIKKRVDEIKLDKTSLPPTVPVPSTTMIAEDLKALKELVDLGILSQDEFDAKKKQLLGL